MSRTTEKDVAYEAYLYSRKNHPNLDEKDHLQYVAGKIGKSPKTISRMRNEGQWEARVLDVQKKELQAQRKATDDRRRKVWNQLTSGVENLATNFVYRSAGICGMCKGEGEVTSKRQGKMDCPACKATGLYDPAKISPRDMLAVRDAMIEMWGANPNEQEEGSSATPWDEFTRRQMEMLRASGLRAPGEKN